MSLVGSLPIVEETSKLPIHKIICIGRNYAEHAREMGHDPSAAPPFFFFKPLSALSLSPAVLEYPHFTQQLEYELELVVAIGRSGRSIALEAAGEHVLGFALGLDMTCRDQQKIAKQRGLPWELAKGFDASAPCTAIVRGGLGDLENYGDMVLSCNEKVVQRGCWRDMVWSIPHLIAEVSRYITLEVGDLIFTGTPAGVGPVVAGDILRGSMAGFSQTLELQISPAQ